MQITHPELEEISEGETKIIVPREALIQKVPPKDPAFFNPRAKLNRDYSILAYSVFWKNFDKPKIFLDGMSGIGARSLRIANEINKTEKVIVNDINPKALQMFSHSAVLNNLKNIQVSENEVCRFFSEFSQKEKRGSIVDVDPFGSPSKYLDCAIRATMHGGMLSCTATDLQVLHGLFNHACRRRYHGIPIKTEYGNEIAIRLILGCTQSIASRLDIKIAPLFVENNFHYYRTYVKILNKPTNEEILGYIKHCKSCGNRGITNENQGRCELCDSEMIFAGPLWMGKLFDKQFVKTMVESLPNFTLDKKCSKNLPKCVLESEMPGTYFTLDEIASKMKSAPLSLSNAVSTLQDDGYLASSTSLNPAGFRTNCKINKILEIFENYPV